jgi:hypothetical protein
MREMNKIHRQKSIVSQSCTDRALGLGMPEKIDGTDFELCEFSDQCESCVHYGPVYFGHKDYFDSREGHYHCKSCVEGMRDDPRQFVDDDDEEEKLTIESVWW